MRLKSKIGSHIIALRSLIAAKVASPSRSNWLVMGAKLEEPSSPLKVPYQYTTAEMALWYNICPLKFFALMDTRGQEVNFFESGILFWFRLFPFAFRLPGTNYLTNLMH